ncbi:IS3 family transposase, partial [Streptomyces sp. NPDC127084]|uniref:IS3 family transposase n=1 Tax=Streptomyces sp. NPDC127084 TaxID=3347133 RepID=UPI00366236B3
MRSWGGCAGRTPSRPRRSRSCEKPRSSSRRKAIGERHVRVHRGGEDHPWRRFLCRLLKVARSSFYAWLAARQTRAARQAADEALAHKITVIHLASRGTYGVPRIHAELRRLGR